ncbi:hypothetical protein PFISCL1PPCAC_3738, partial [Pristionchus fissidentatus]
SLITTSFCLLLPSPTFQHRLISSLRAGCIPVLLSRSQPMPFQDTLDWKLAAIHFKFEVIEEIPEALKSISEGTILELRRRGRIFLARIDDVQALSKSLIAAISERFQVGLPLFPQVPAHLIFPNADVENATLASPQITSKSAVSQMKASTM